MNICGQKCANWPRLEAKCPDVGCVGVITVGHLGWYNKGSLLGEVRYVCTAKLISLHKSALDRVFSRPVPQLPIFNISFWGVLPFERGMWWSFDGHEWVLFDFFLRGHYGRSAPSGTGSMMINHECRSARDWALPQVNFCQLVTESYYAVCLFICVASCWQILLWTFVSQLISSNFIVTFIMSLARSNLRSWRVKLWSKAQWLAHSDPKLCTLSLHSQVMEVLFSFEQEAAFLCDYLRSVYQWDK